MKILRDLTPKLPKARSGEFEVKRFEPNTQQSPITDAVSFTTSTTENNTTVVGNKSTVVNLKNGNSISSDGERVQVRDQMGLLQQEFEGDVNVTPQRVTIDNDAMGRSQSLFSDGTNTMFDEATGLIVQFNDEGHRSPPPRIPELLQVKPKRHGTAAYLFAQVPEISNEELKARLLAGVEHQSLLPGGATEALAQKDTPSPILTSQWLYADSSQRA